MTEGRTEAFLKLFCITKSRHGSFEPGWQSWMVLCLCIVSSFATASSGTYFHRNNAATSSVICFTVSAVGFSLATVTFIAMVMGCKRRPTLTDPMRNDGELTAYTNHGVLEHNTCIQIEHEDLVVSRTENQMWMNPVFKEYDKALYEADWNLEKDSKKPVERVETDFDERDSNSFHSSATLTCSYRSYSDDEGYFQNSSKESNVKETGKYSSEHQGNRLIHAHDLLECGQVVENEPVIDMNVKLSIDPQISESDQFKLANQLKKDSASFLNIQNCALIIPESKTHFHSRNIPDVNLNLANYIGYFYSNNNAHDLNMDINDRSAMKFSNSLLSVIGEEDIKSADIRKNASVCKEQSNYLCLKKPSSYQNSKITSMSIKNDTFPHGVDTENDSTENVFHYKKSFSSGRSSDYHIDVNTSMPDNLSSVVDVEDDSPSSIIHCEFSLPTETITYKNTLSSKTPEICPAVDRNSSSIPPDQDLVANKQTQRSRNKLDLPVGFPSLPYPILPKESSNHQSKKQRRGSSKTEETFRYEKRPLLDINGKPLSQKELVKALTGLLTNGLQELPKHRLEQKVEQNFQMDIESLKPIPC